MLAEVESIDCDIVSSLMMAYHGYFKVTGLVSHLLHSNRVKLFLNTSYSILQSLNIAHHHSKSSRIIERYLSCKTEILRRTECFHKQERKLVHQSSPHYVNCHVHKYINRNNVLLLSNQGTNPCGTWLLWKPTGFGLAVKRRIHSSSSHWRKSKNEGKGK